MRRREFTTLIGCAALLPRATRAQQASALSRVGLVSIGADPGDPVVFRPFLEQLRDLGYIEGRNISLERRFAAGRDELIGDFVADLVQRKVDIIVVTGNRESITAKHATSTIPIVTIVSTDPIRTGLAASLARPGGNVTGLTTMDRGKGRQLPAEVVEGRASPEGNSRQAAVVRTLSRDTTSIRLAAVRRSASGFKPRAGRRLTRGRSPVR